MAPDGAPQTQFQVAADANELTVVTAATKAVTAFVPGAPPPGVYVGMEFVPATKILDEAAQREALRETEQAQPQAQPQVTAPQSQPQPKPAQPEPAQPESASATQSAPPHAWQAPWSNPQTAETAAQPAPQPRVL